MITTEEWSAYNSAVSKIADGAASSVERSVLTWCRGNPNATVAETREAAKLIMEGYVQSYDVLASSFAARWYDRQAEENGISLQNAVTCAVYSPTKNNDVARYQVRKLTKEGPAAFAKACGEYARNDAMRALNETIIANVGRDKKAGVRFARVPTGRETCTFCIMLASRGAVYHSRKTAGEFKHFHRRCDCKVVPGFEDDPMAMLVQGHDPWVAYRTWRRIESAHIFAEHLYRASVRDISSQVAFMDDRISKLWHEQKISRDYRGIFEQFIKEYEGEGTIACQRGVKPQGKELQLASWLSSRGHDVELLVPSGKKGDRTPDIRLNGELWEIKRITSCNPTKAKSRIGDGLNQADSVIVDLSVNGNADIIEMAAIEVLDDPRARRIMVINAGKAKIYEK